MVVAELRNQFLFLALLLPTKAKRDLRYRHENFIDAPAAAARASCQAGGLVHAYDEMQLAVIGEHPSEDAALHRSDVLIEVHDPQFASSSGLWRDGLLRSDSTSKPVFAVPPGLLLELIADWMRPANPGT